MLTLIAITLFIALWFCVFPGLSILAKTSTTGICELCNQSTSQRCKTCHQAQYCSKECQKRDLSIHRLLCYEAKSFSEKQRPASLEFNTVYRRAIFFNPSYSWAEFIWVSLQLHEVKFRSITNFVWLPTLEPFGMISGRTAFDTIDTNRIAQRALSTHIRVSYLENFLKDGSHKQDRRHPEQGQSERWVGQLEGSVHLCRYAPSRV